MKIIEKFILLRPLNYLRVKHKDYLLYNVLVPLILTVMLYIPVFFVTDSFNIYSSDGLLKEISAILVILCPFYIAALAAVATFSGAENLDAEMKGDSPPSLSLLARGEFEESTLTLRHFLSLMFGYCSLMSLALFFANTFIRYIVNNTNSVNISFEILSYSSIAFFLFYTFLLMNLLTTTMLGLYFLCDKIHRD